MRQIRLGLAAVLLVAIAASAPAGEVVVLKGGTVVPLKEHWVRKGNNAYMTRADGTLLMVPVSEIDREKTAAASRAAAAPPPPAPAPAASTPAEVVRTAKDGPKAKVRITDADVSHPLDMEAEAAGDEKKDQAAPGGVAKVEVGDYTQEKNGESLAIRGTLRNTGQGVADGLRLQVSAIDDKGQPIDGGAATLSKGTIAPGGSVDFNATLKVGDKVPASLRFAPQWAAPKPPAAAAAQPGVPTAATGAPAAAPKPVPTPYGRGTLYAPPVANAPSQAPADGKTGYIPGATSPDNQPKPPNR